MQQRQREYDQEVSIVELQVRQAYRKLDEEAERYRIQKKSLELAQRRVKSTELLLDAGRAAARD